MWVVGALLSGAARAAERQFFVILANSPKQFTDGPPELVNPQLINRQYFDRISGNGIDSFAEYWEEISYGDVTIRGTTSDWINLPWRIMPDPAATGEGSADAFENDKPMILVDLDGDGLPNEDAAFAQGGNDVNLRTGNNPLWKPGERFLDLNNNGRWDGLDEGANQADYFTEVPSTDPSVCVEHLLDPRTDAPLYQPDGKPDLCGPWIDLNDDGIPDNPAGCVYLRDSDNDRNPDCCPTGPGRPGCERLGLGGQGAPPACPATLWQGPGDQQIIDCNGNLIPDACDINCALPECVETGWVERNRPFSLAYCADANVRSQDVLPFTRQDDQCAPGDGDGIPDECQFTTGDIAAGCILTPATSPDDPCSGRQLCDGRTDRVPVQRCEYHDYNGNGQLDVVEPFENFLRISDQSTRSWVPLLVPLCNGGLDHGQLCTGAADCRDFPGQSGATCDGRFCLNGANEGLRCQDNRDCPDGVCNSSVGRAYIEANYPGDPMKVLTQYTSRNIYAARDPLGKLTGQPCTCRDGSPCLQTVNGPDGTPITNPNGQPLINVCVAGAHAHYDPPDLWLESGQTGKMELVGVIGSEAVPIVTPEPPWYAQAWDDFISAHRGPARPPWKLATCGDGECTPNAVPFNDTSRRQFLANWGGLGDGRLGALVPPNVDNLPILPEEVDGVGTPLVVFDGPAEFIDLPSSKYHVAGDGRLGEVTSPFNTEIWGHDRGTHNPLSPGFPDSRLPAAGPYAVSVHGNFGRDAGNMLHLEFLTFLNNDWTLDGLVDQGSVRAPGSESYTADNVPATPNNGTASLYPFNRRRLLEDCIEILDDVFDFDDLIDVVSLDRMNCDRVDLHAFVPPSLGGPGTVSPQGVISGIVLLPPGAHPAGIFPAAHASCGAHPTGQQGGNNAGSCQMFPIHNEDGLAGGISTFKSQISWNIFFHDLVISLSAGSQSGFPAGNRQTAYAAHEYLHIWERFPDLYDYDVFDQPGPIINCPIGRWDIMASGGLVHPVPFLKERTCTDWTRPVDLTTILTPGVDKVLTLPPAAVVRNDSYFYLQNEKRPQERYYLWSAGARGFDLNMPGAGMLLLHTDVLSNSDALPQQQRSGIRPAALIVQADGNDDLQACSIGGNDGDAGDVWPGSSDARQFSAAGTRRGPNLVLDDHPKSQWHTVGSPTGLEILDIVPDGAGSIQLTLNWAPTSIPSLRFINPPGGETQGVPPRFRVTFDVTDVFGGTKIEVFARPDQRICRLAPHDPCSTNDDCPSTTTDANFCRYDVVPGSSGVTKIGEIPRKNTSGTSRMSVDWLTGGFPDGRYVLFAKLTPGQGSNGFEDSHTIPRAGRNNGGNGSLIMAIDGVDLSGSRLETWTVACVDAGCTQWRVNSTLTQPVLNGADPDAAKYPPAALGVPYRTTNPASPVDFVIIQGSVPFEVDDTFTFTTTGTTAVSAAVTMTGGLISLNPVARMVASPLSGDPPLRVQFDARQSISQNGDPLTYRWTFGDGSAPIAGAQVEHTFTRGGTFTVVLRATDSAGRFGETSVDIVVANDAPVARISAMPTSGSAPLQVQFSATGSSDRETSADNLIYVWDFGNGLGANSQRVPGAQFQQIQHTYDRRPTRPDGSACVGANDPQCACAPATPCVFTATVTVIDEGGKESTASLIIVVGNTLPTAVVTTSTTQGASPLTVLFNASGSSDADGDPITVTWNWGDGTASETWPVSGPPNSGGNVPHTYLLPQGQMEATFQPTAVLSDGRGGNATWPGVTITVSTAPPGVSDPRAIFSIKPDPPVAGQVFEADGSASFDRPSGGAVASYTWSWGDGSANSTGAKPTHTYANPGTYTISLTVADSETPPNTNTATKSVVVAAAPQPGDDNRPPTAIIQVSPNEGVPGTTFTFDGRSSSDPDDGDTLTYQWVFGDGSSGTGAVVTHAYESAGNYTVRLTVRDSFNASTDATRSVVVRDVLGNANPVAFIASGQRTGPAPLTILFNGQNSYDPDGDPLTFTWRFRLGDTLIDTLSGAIVSRTFSSAGTYSVELEVSDGRGGVHTVGPQTVTVTTPLPPANDNESPRPPPDEPAPLPVRPPQFCGLGMLTGMFGVLFGLVATLTGRRRMRIV